jgi:uncharacterized protein YndB with AHSA1/START domain
MRFWAGHRGRMTVVDIDLRVGGSWRYVMVTDDGHEVAFHGEFREIVPNERIVNTEVYEAMPEGEVLNIVTFTETDEGRTHLHLLTECGSREVRDAIIGSGMEGGMQEQMDMLEELAASLA